MGAGEALEFGLPVAEESEVAGHDRPNYGRVVAEQLKGLRERAGLHQTEMAKAMSSELGRNIDLPAWNRWEKGHQMPKSDILVAAMRVAGIPDPAEAPRDPRRVLETELQDLKRQVEMLSRRVSRDDQLPMLPTTMRGEGRWLTVADAAKRVKVSRETLYAWIRDKRVPAYVWMGRTVLTVRDLDRLASE